MIDLVKLEIEGDFPPLGKCLRVTHRVDVVSESFTADRYWLYGEGADFEAQIKDERKSLWLTFCPLKILQGHNGIGSNNLRKLVMYSVLEICNHLNIPITPELEKKLCEGDYRLREVHVTELHKMPHALIPAFCQSIRGNAPDDLHAVPLDRGIGVRLWPNSRYRQVLIYDKVHYFMDKTWKHREVLVAGASNWTKASLQMRFDQLLDYLKQGIRIECRLKSAYLCRNKLDRGSAWTKQIARQEYIKMLSTIPLSDVPPVEGIEKIITELSGPEKALVLLWKDGRDPKKFASSKAAYYRLCKSIKEKSGIDIKRPCSNFPSGVSWPELIKPESIVPNPSFSRHSAIYFDTHDPVFIERLNAKKK